MPTPVEITIYTTRTCPYCRRAKELLQKKDLPYNEISVDGDFEARAKMTERANTSPHVDTHDRASQGARGVQELDLARSIRDNETSHFGVNEVLGVSAPRARNHIFIDAFEHSASGFCGDEQGEFGWHRQSLDRAAYIDMDS